MHHGFYIEPVLKHYTKLTDLLGSDEFPAYVGSSITIGDLFAGRLTLLVSEPGYGKTRALKEACLRSNKPCLFVDLKTIGKQDIERYIQSCDLKSVENNQYTEEIHKSCRFKKNRFQLINGDADFQVCFDGLDEVQQEGFSEVVNNIKKFIRSYPRVNILISCRKVYIRQWESLFDKFGFTDYVNICVFNGLQVRSFLVDAGYTEEQAQQICDKLQSRHQCSVVQVPRYLEMLVEVRIEDFNITRCDLFEKFISHKLKLDSEKADHPNANILARKVLEKLALIMEIYQKNAITKDDLMEFFDDTHSNLNISLLNQVPINTFFNRTVLKDNGNTVEFENREFQEYLAAREMIRLGRVEQVAFDLASATQLCDFHPSWLNTLSFAAELAPELIEPIIAYLFSNDFSITPGDYAEVLLTPTNIARLQSQAKRLLFELIFLYYQKHKTWMSADLAESLSLCYEAALYERVESSWLTEEPDEEKRAITSANCVMMVAHLYERQILTDEQVDCWKRRCRELLGGENQNNVVLRHVLFAVGKFKDLELLTEELVDKLFSANDDLIIRALVSALDDIDPNAPLACKCFLRAIKEDRGPFIKFPLYRVSEKEAIKQVLQELCDDAKLLQRLIDDDYLSRCEYDGFFESIRAVLDDQLVCSMKELVFKAFSSSGGESVFIKGIALLIEQFMPGFSVCIINKLEARSLPCAIDLFAVILKDDQIEGFINAIKSLPDAPAWIAAHTLNTIRSSERDDATCMYEAGRQYLPDEYSELEKSKEEVGRKQNIEQNHYKRFQQLLAEEGSVAIRYFVEHSNNLVSLISETERAGLESRIVQVFEQFNPGECKVVQDSQGYSIQGLRREPWVYSIKLANQLGLDVTQYRQKLLSFIPLANYGCLQEISELVANPTADELKQAWPTFFERDDDLLSFGAVAIAKFCQQYNLADSVPYLKDLIKSVDLSVNDKSRILEAIAQLVSEEGKAYFQETFNLHIDDQESSKLAEIANAILINRFEDDQAVNWRIKQLLARNFANADNVKKRSRRAKPLSDNEIELYEKTFAAPLMQLTDIRHKEKFLDLLGKSFDICEKGTEYNDYVLYLWSIVTEYYKNLRLLGSYEPLYELERFIRNKEKALRGIQWFRYQFIRLRQEYLMYLGRPKMMSDCIKRYNYFKDKQYLDIATPRDLVETIKRVIDTDLRCWVEQEGAYRLIENYRPAKAIKFEREDLIQKTIKSQLEVILLSAGFKKEELHVYREMQLLDGTKPDFLIAYGPIGSVVVELKLSSNPQAKPNHQQAKDYKEKLKKYVDGLRAQHGLFVVLQTSEDNPLEKIQPDLVELYQGSNIEVICFNCLADNC